MSGGWVYIVSNRRNGTLYVGVTSDIHRRAHEHREGLVEGFSKRYGLTRLVWAEPCPTIIEAIRREKALKRLPRADKVRLIHSINPDWNDYYDTLV
jgi:putative endonuclease